VKARAVFAAPRGDTEDDEDPAAEAAAQEHGPEQLAELSQAKRCIDRCLAKLGTLHREVLALRVCGPEYKEQEVAKLLGVPLGTVKSRTSIALKALAGCVERCREGGLAHG